MTVMAASNASAETVGRFDEAPFVVDVGPVGATEHADGGDADDGDADDGDDDDGDTDVHSRHLWLAFQADSEMPKMRHIVLTVAVPASVSRLSG